LCQLIDSSILHFSALYVCIFVKSENFSDIQGILSMSTLCQITEVQDEKSFLSELERGKVNQLSGGGWGRFKGEIPAINSTIEEKGIRGKVHYFKVLHTHLILEDRVSFYDKSTESGQDCLDNGDMYVSMCIIFVVEIGK